MKLVEVVTGNKTDIRWGGWKATPPKRGDFPCSSRRRGAFPLTSRWRWTIVSFSVVPRNFRVLIAYHTEVPDYKAILAEIGNDDCRIIAKYEFHQTHPGWHLHMICEDISEITPGIVVPAGLIRVPGVGRKHRRSAITVDNSPIDDRIAEALAARKYRIPHTEDLMIAARLP